MTRAPFGLFDAVSWPRTTRSRSKRHLVGDAGAAPDGRGARAICGQALPLGTTSDPDEARERCVLCWGQVARRGAAFYAERTRRLAVPPAPPGPPSGGDAVAWRLAGTDKCTRRHVLEGGASIQGQGTMVPRTLCGRIVPVAQLVSPAHAVADCAHCGHCRAAGRMG